MLSVFDLIFFSSSILGMAISPIVKSKYKWPLTLKGRDFFRLQLEQLLHIRCEIKIVIIKEKLIFTRFIFILSLQFAKISAFQYLIICVLRNKLKNNLFKRGQQHFLNAFIEHIGFESKIFAVNFTQTYSFENWQIDPT